MSLVIEVASLRKAYGKVRAVEDVSFDVHAGEIFGLIGPNGAGKTTTLECVEGLRRPDAGRIRVLARDPAREARALHPRIGVQLQEAHLQKRITVREAVTLWSRLYAHTVDPELLLQQLGLQDKRDSWFMTLSGGQKQRLFIALALIHDPEVVFLDELTTGLDPQARRAIWDLVRGIRSRGKTVVLTTHLMEEAERLCDRVAIIDHGRIIDVGAPADLVRRHCPEQAVRITTDDHRMPALLAACRSVTRVEPVAGGCTAHGASSDFLDDVLACLSTNGVHVVALQSQVATLEDVFLRLTGHSIRD
ncbi:multidrug ABC transporter ATP-binding protein [Luteitalea sp. TBR-22]|uniref:ABC transporter ATP-binding protein n=1 Tax=Luteitalea sp. TBR-22 TaxID=2802971 RepID=UPI001AF1A9C8|nr:ABC transporter ATP-binding protein [Luteitalea sp. TBR-22]BCS33102.1 multidrug ABC transporter ATP-binding protein [Luteitalea sp. TBR-22]